MSKAACNALKVSFALLSATLLTANKSLAANLAIDKHSDVRSLHKVAPESNLIQARNVLIAQIPTAPSTVTTDPTSSTLQQINQHRQIPSTPKSIAQVTSVSQLSDVKPTDWAFQALQSLVERYGCIAGYPNSSYRGNRALTRYEFAAGLNACLDRVNELIATATADQVSKEDLATLQQLQSEFGSELATLRGRVDALEVNTAQLEANQFSTTTKLSGEAIFFLGGVFGNTTADTDDNPDNNPDLNENIILGDRVRLVFDTSFSGKDRLRIRLQGRNITPFNNNVTGTRMTRLSIDGDSRNNVEVDYIYYRFPAGKQTAVTVSAFNTELSDIIYTLNPLLEGSGNGSFSRFGRYSPIYRAFGAGATVAHKFNDNFNLTLGYMAPDSASPVSGNGFFNGNYSALAQLVYSPKKGIDFGIIYARSYFSETSQSGVNLTFTTGSTNATQPFGNVATSTDSVQLGTSIQLSQRVVLSGWAEYTFANSQVSDDNADIFNFAVNLAFPDLGKRGNLGAIIFGIPPKVVNNSISANEDDNTSFHIEALYRYQITDNIAITPGVIVITNPEHNDNNDTIYVGGIRTTFKF